MAVMARESWTDERIDDLKEGMKERFDQVDKRFDQVDERFKQVDQRFDRLEGDIRELRSDIKEMQRIMMGGFVTLLIALIGTNAL